MGSRQGGWVKMARYVPPPPPGDGHTSDYKHFWPLIRPAEGASELSIYIHNLLTSY